MVMYLNQAALESWLELKAPVHAALVRIFENADVDPALIDVWTEQMIANSYEEEGATGAPRIRRSISLAKEAPDRAALEG